MAIKGKGKGKKCFVIGPIGKRGSPERTKADWLLEGIIKPVLEGDPLNYDVKRADQISEPGLITDQIIAATIDADLAIADLTGANPNAFYELAIRHMEQKAVIHMAEEGELLPFDIKDYRAVFYKIEHPDDLKRAQAELAEQVEAIEDPAYMPSNPITQARGMVELKRSADSKDKVLADLVEGQRRLESRLSSIEPPSTRDPPSRNALLEGFLAGAERAKPREGRLLQSFVRRVIDEHKDEEISKLTDEVIAARLAAATVTPPDEEGES